MTDREIMKQALEALEFYYDQHGEESDARVITTLRERLAQPEQKPVAWLTEERYAELHTAKRPWVGLTEQDFSAINQSSLTKLQAATCAESILKEKNGMMKPWVKTYAGGKPNYTTPESGETK